MDACQPPGLLITNGEFVGRWSSKDSVGIEIAETCGPGKVNLANCAFWGPLDMALWARSPQAQLAVSSTNFCQWDINGVGTVSGPGVAQAADGSAEVVLKAVTEVASVGGFVKQYSITVDPVRMRALGITLSEIGEAVAASNMDTGGRTVELSEFEFMVRGRGYLDGIADLEMVPIRAEGGVPVLLRDVARVEIVPDERRRSLLFDLDESVQALMARPGGSDPEAVRLSAVYHNLLRQSAQTG